MWGGGRQTASSCWAGRKGASPAAARWLWTRCSAGRGGRRDGWLDGGPDGWFDGWRDGNSSVLAARSGPGPAALGDPPRPRRVVGLDAPVGTGRRKEAGG